MLFASYQFALDENGAYGKYPEIQTMAKKARELGFPSNLAIKFSSG